MATFQIHAELGYSVPEPSTMLLGIHALGTPYQKILDERFEVTSGAGTTPSTVWEELPLETGENRYLRLTVAEPTWLGLTYNASVKTSFTLVGQAAIHKVPIAEVRRSALPYLFPSRYCQSDRLGRLAAKMFGGIDHPYDQVVAISDWIFENIDYLSGATNAETSAFDTVTQRAGVCRDFAHLGIAFCRALSIPARYVSVYACQMQPPDFHACFEACIGNRWFIFDPTRLAPLNGLVRIAAGRDAADASIATIFGWMDLTGMWVSCCSEDFDPLWRADLEGKAIFYEA